MSSFGGVDVDDGSGGIIIISGCGCTGQHSKLVNICAPTYLAVRTCTRYA